MLKILLHLSKNYTSVHTSYYHRLTHGTHGMWYSFRAKRTLEEEMVTLRHVSAMDSTGGDIENNDIIEDMVFSIDQINRKISSLKRHELG